jgi:hypothetical protein
MGEENFADFETSVLTIRVLEGRCTPQMADALLRRSDASADELWLIMRSGAGDVRFGIRSMNLILNRGWANRGQVNERLFGNLTPKNLRIEVCRAIIDHQGMPLWLLVSIADSYPDLRRQVLAKLVANVLAELDH